LAQTISYEVRLAFILLSFLVLVCRYNENWVIEHTTSRYTMWTTLWSCYVRYACYTAYEHNNRSEIAVQGTQTLHLRAWYEWHLRKLNLFTTYVVANVEQAAEFRMLYDIGSNLAIWQPTWLYIYIYIYARTHTHIRCFSFPSSNFDSSLSLFSVKHHTLRK
jgi:hypothetical protein